VPGGAGAHRRRRADPRRNAGQVPALAIFVPEDETCFFLYEAASADAVREVVHRAALSFERVSEARTESKGVLS
jgi:hypothetical protein